VYGFSLGLNGALTPHVLDALKGKVTPQQAMVSAAADFQTQLQQQQG
jgi:hypothetical protein